MPAETGFLPIRQRGFSGGEGSFSSKGDRIPCDRLIQSGKGQFFLAVGAYRRPAMLVVPFTVHFSTI